MPSKTEEQVEQLEELEGQPEVIGEQLDIDYRLVMVEILGREATFRCQVCKIYNTVMIGHCDTVE